PGEGGGFRHVIIGDNNPLLPPPRRVSSCTEVSPIIKGNETEQAITKGNKTEHAAIFYVTSWLPVFVSLK
ncbi:MAG: hypothetical protein K2N38_09280, partial [Oscillospiraceae bacterium]|nr:hypothetical protein [Oscillospiraceae bacterium]